MTRRLVLATSVLLAFGAPAGAQPPGDWRNADAYRQGYTDGVAACGSGGQMRRVRGPDAYRQGYADGYRECTLGPSGTANSPSPRAAPPARVDWSGWRLLGSNVLQQPSEKLMVGTSAGRFSQVRISSSRGAPYVESVDIRLLNNELRSFDVRRRLSSGEAIDFDLGGVYKVSSVTVTGRPDPRAVYEIAAR